MIFSGVFRNFRARMFLIGECGWNPAAFHLSPHMKINPRVLLLAGILLVPSIGRGAVVIDNLATGTQSYSASISGPEAPGFFFGTFEDREVAFSFTTGSTAVYLTELTFVIAIGNSFRDPIQLTMSTGASVPGGVGPVVLGSVTPATSPTSQTLTLNPTVPPLLSASTLYWIHVTVPAGKAIYSFANTNTPVIEPGWSLGTTWEQSPLSSWSELTSGPRARIRMTVDPIPEPGAALLLGSLGAIVLVKRRSRRA